MTFSLEKYKKSRNPDALSSQLDKINPEKKNTSYSDDRYWTLKRDKAGNGFAVIRFLDSPQDEDAPCVRYWRYAFQGPGGWYIENSPCTFDRPCPAMEYNSTLWAAGNKEQAIKQKRKLIFTSNILVVNDPSAPENNGKVFLYKFGKKIYSKISAMMFPDLPDDPRVNPFDLLEGADFRLKVTIEDKWPSYTESKFASPGPISLNGKALTEAEIGRVVSAQHSLSELLSEDHFKSYDVLKARLDKVLGGARETAAPEKAKPRPIATVASNMGDDDDDIDPAFFERLKDDQ